MKSSRDPAVTLPHHRGDRCRGAGIRVLLDGVFNHVGRGFAPFRDVRKVTVFGSARTETHDPLYAQATEIAARRTAILRPP